MKTICVLLPLVLLATATFGEEPTRPWSVGSETVFAAIQYRVGNDLTLRRDDGILLTVPVSALVGEDRLIYEDWKRRSDRGETRSPDQRMRQATRYARRTELNHAAWQSRREALAGRYESRMARFRQRSAWNTAMNLAVLRQGLPGNDLLSQQLRWNEMMASGSMRRRPLSMFLPLVRSLE